LSVQSQDFGNEIFSSIVEIGNVFYIDEAQQRGKVRGRRRRRRRIRIQRYYRGTQGACG
jgi:hypothetical protein